MKQEIERIYEEEKLDEDKLDPFTVGLYYNIKGTKYADNYWIQKQTDVRLQYYLKSLMYFEKSGVHDRIILLCMFVAEAYDNIGNFDQANMYYQKATTLNNESGQLPESRKLNFKLRLKAAKLFTKSEFDLSPDLLKESEELYKEVMTSDFEKMIMYAMEYVFTWLAEVFIRFNQLGKIQKIQDMNQRFIASRNKELAQIGLQVDVGIRGIPILSRYIEGIIKINKMDLSSNLEGYDDLQEILDQYEKAFLTPAILKHQLNFLLKRFRGFSEPDVLNEMGDKINKLIEIGILNKNGNDWLNGVLLSARHKLLTQEVHEVIDYLESTKNQFIEFGQHDLVQLIEHEISELMTLDLSPEHADRIQQLQLQKYIKKVNEVMKRM